MRRLLTVSAAILAGLAALLVIAALRDAAVAPVPREEDTGPAYRAGERALGAAVAIGPLRDDAGYRRAFVTTFDSLTPENELKWERVQPSITRFAFGEADRIVEWAADHGKRVRGHPLIWDQQIPGWLAGGRWTPAQLEKLVRDHVERVVERYRGRVESWDAVNEPFEDDGTWSETLFHAVLGERFVEIAFRAARAADPDARLFLNEIAAERPGPKQNALFRLVRDLKRRGVPIDGVGFQNHTDARRAPTEAELTRTLERFAGLGLDVEITEMDVILAPGEPDSDQAAPYTAAARACRAVARCTGLTVWGVTDAYSWLGGAKRPLLFDAAAKPKPARGALLDAWAR